MLAVKIFVAQKMRKKVDENFFFFCKWRYK